MVVYRYRYYDWMNWIHSWDCNSFWELIENWFIQNCGQGSPLIYLGDPWRSWIIGSNACWYLDDLHVQWSSLDDLPCIMVFGVIPMVSVHESDSNLHTYGSYLTLPLSLYLSGLLHPRALVVTVDWIWSLNVDSDVDVLMCGGNCWWPDLVQLSLCHCLGSVLGNLVVSQPCGCLMLGRSFFVLTCLLLVHSIAS